MKTQKKVHWAREEFWEIDYMALDENMWDEATNSWLLSKMWEEWCIEIKERIEKALIDNLE